MALLRYGAEEARNIAKARKAAEQLARVEGSLAKKLATAEADALQSQIDDKEPSIDAGTASQYWRGDKTWQTLNKSSVGLSAVDNTSDEDKPVSAEQQTALDGKASLGDLAGVQSQVDAIVISIGAIKFAQSFGNDTDLSYTITHGKGTTDIIVQIQAVTASLAIPDAVITDANTVTVGFDVAPGINAFRAIII